MADADKKTCSKCHELKPAFDFRVKRCKGRKDTVSSSCRICENAYFRKYAARRREDPVRHERRKFTQLNLKYGVDRERFIDMMLAQDFRCPVCADPVPVDKWIVDHDHACCSGEKSCGKCVRGLLDKKCNTLLGQALDNVATLSRAQIYLEASGG